MPKENSRSYDRENMQDFDPWIRQAEEETSAQALSELLEEVNDMEKRISHDIIDE